MAIVNRDLDVTQQRYVFNIPAPVNGVSVFTSGPVGQSQILTIGIMPCASQLLQCAVAGYGLSGSPILQTQVQRFVVGSGVTTIAISTSFLTLQTYSTSGMQTFLLPASGASGYGLLKGDVLQIVNNAANTSGQIAVDAVVQILQDVKSDYGV